MVEVIKLLFISSLGGADYYRIPGTVTSRPDKVIPKEKILEELCSTSPAGRGSA